MPASNQNMRIGTFGLGNDNQKIDYLLLSPALFERVTSCGLLSEGGMAGEVAGSMVSL